MSAPPIPVAPAITPEAAITAATTTSVPLARDATFSVSLRVPGISIRDCEFRARGGRQL